MGSKISQSNSANISREPAALSELSHAHIHSGIARKYGNKVCSNRHYYYYCCCCYYYYYYLTPIPTLLDSSAANHGHNTKGG